MGGVIKSPKFTSGSIQYLRFLCKGGRISISDANNILGIFCGYESRDELALMLFEPQCAVVPPGMDQFDIMALQDSAAIASIMLSDTSCSGGRFLL